MTTELIDGSIFLHVPKTGGTWAYEVLRRLRLIRRPVGKNQGGHSDFTRALLYPRNKPRWREWSNPANLSLHNLLAPGRHAKLPFTFCFVRHPVSWYESAWRFLPTIPQAKRATWINAEKRLKRIMHPFGIACRCLHSDFNHFVHNILQAFPGYVTWIYTLFAPPEVSFVGKQESLTNDLIAVLRDRGFQFDQELVRTHPRANESQSFPVKWDASLLREVQEVEAAALRRFGYRRRHPAATAAGEGEISTEMAGEFVPS